MQITNLTKGTILAEKASVADNFFTRLKGLLGTSCLPEGGGLLIRPCNSVHTLGMRYAIDVIFVDAGQRVVKIVPGLAPGKVAMCREGRYVVELPAGVLARTGTTAGDSLELSD